MAYTWSITKVFPSPIQRRVKITHDSANATPLTDYRCGGQTRTTDHHSPRPGH